MQIETTIQNGQAIAVVKSDAAIITDVPSALDFLMNVRYQTDCDRIALNREALAEDFFSLRTGLAGEVLQKFVTYRAKLAVYGDFSRYGSGPLRDFIYESNRGNAVFFASDEDEAVSYLSKAI